MHTISKAKKVFVAMSGGVDSSVVAGLMKDAGYDVVGVTMCFSILHPDSKKPSCCGAQGIDDARRVAHQLDIPHYVLDFAADIDNFIIKDFISEYLNGRTPNPCVRCNQHLKFGTLLKKVRALGADYLATGHYARVHHNAERDRYEVMKAVDPGKDQSYFLYSIPKDTLPQLLFPLGDKVKNQVRDLARKYDIHTADKPESQDICFVPDGGYKKFIEKNIGEAAFVPGVFKNHKGEVIGEHKGIANFTIGQRDKLGIALGHPVYVYKIEQETNTVYVGLEEHLYSQALMASQFNPLSIDSPRESLEVNVRIRYNSLEARGTLTGLDEQKIRVDFKDPQKSVTPGQSVVFYRDDILLGGAVIDQPC